MYGFSPHISGLAGINTANAVDGEALVFDAATNEWVPSSISVDLTGYAQLGENETVTGNWSFSGTTSLPNGSAGSPALRFTNDIDCGFYYSSAAGQNSVHVAAGGTEVMRWTDFSGAATVVAMVADITNFQSPTSTLMETGYLAFSGTGGQRGQVRFLENSSNGNNYVNIRGANNVASNFNLTLPSSAPTDGQVMTGAATGGQLSFTDPGLLDFSAMKTGTSQVNAGASAGELWADSSTNQVYLGV